MKIKFITNACCIYEAEGFRLLADPWLSETCFEGSWVHDPPIKTKPEDVLDVDALYISHIHPDHCDPETLKHFRRNIPIITLHDKFSFCAKHLTKMGFTNVLGIEDRASLKVGPFEAIMFGPFTKHPYHADACEIGNVVDSSILIEHKGKSVLNTNDNSPDLKTAHWLGEKYKPTIAQLNYNNAGPYPACFINLTEAKKREEATKCVERNLAHMYAVASAMGPQWVMPFAGAYKLGGKWAHMNEYLGTTSVEHAVAYLENQGIRAFSLGENEVFDLA